MATIEKVQERYGLPKHLAKSIVDIMIPGEEIITQIGYRRLEWLKENTRQAGYRFLAASVLGNTLNIYVMTDQGLGVIDFTFRGDNPLDEFWRATITARSTVAQTGIHIASVPHRPN